jgi:hypothetical protein
MKTDEDEIEGPMDLPLRELRGRGELHEHTELTLAFTRLAAQPTAITPLGPGPHRAARLSPQSP